MIIQSSLCFISVSLPVLLTICERVLFCSASRCVSVGSVRPTKCSDLLQVKNTMFEFWGWYFIIYITWMKLRTKSTQGLGTVWCNVSLGTDRLPRRSSTNKQICHVYYVSQNCSWKEESVVLFVLSVSLLYYLVGCWTSNGIQCLPWQLRYTDTKQFNVEEIICETVWMESHWRAVWNMGSAAI